MTSIPPRSSNRPNRREHSRLEVDAPARLLEGTTVLTGRIENVGPGGAAFITPEMEPELPVGARVTLVAPGAGDGGGDLEFQGRIIRADEYCDGSGESRSYALGFDHPIDV